MFAAENTESAKLKKIQRHTVHFGVLLVLTSFFCWAPWAQDKKVQKEVLDNELTEEIRQFASKPYAALESFKRIKELVEKGAHARPFVIDSGSERLNKLLEKQSIEVTPHVTKSYLRFFFIIQKKIVRSTRNYF